MEIAIDITHTRAFSRKSDTTEPKTVYTIGMLDSAVRAVVLNSVIKNDEDQLALRELVRHGLKNWENLAHPKTKEPIPFELADFYVLGVGPRKVVSDACMDYLSNAAIREISNEIAKDNYQTEQDRKN